MRKRLLSTLLALCMVLTLLPMNVLAAETETGIEYMDFTNTGASAEESGEPEAPDAQDPDMETGDTGGTGPSGGSDEMLDDGQDPDEDGADETGDAGTSAPSQSEEDAAEGESGEEGDNLSETPDEEPGIMEEPEITEEDPDASVNQKAGEVEAWTYVPALYPIMPFAEGGASASDIVRVHVTATDQDTGDEVDVEGAEVNLYVGAEWKDHAYTEADGYAEISLAGLTLTERKNATVSASKVVARGKAINGSGRDKLFNSFPHDENGDYYRYTLELHSETIDDNGNWLGAEIPVSYETNKVDMVFAIDATGSMSDYINNVKNNVAHFAENLAASGLDIRFGIIEFQDITYDGNNSTIAHPGANGSHWMTNIDDVIATLEKITAKNGGDIPETPLDALGYAAQRMEWRSDAYRFAFVLTDAGYKNNNNYGYTDLAGITKDLSDLDIVTSVITSFGGRNGDLRNSYRELVEGTGGIFANISSSSFDEEMMRLSDSIIESVIKEVDLKLSEPRMLVNMSVCYFADDELTMSDGYREAVKTMLNESAHKLAETTDGHILYDKVILFSTSNRLDFYDETNRAAMADVRIESEEADDGTWWFNVKIINNAHNAGFYDATLYETDDSYWALFKHLKNLEDFKGRQTFTRIQHGGVDANGNSMIFHVNQFAATQTHETGHYLLGFYDEYLNADGVNWRDVGGKPQDAYGLMDRQYDDIEMSKDGIDYAYIDDFESADKSLHTLQSWTYKMSDESHMADILTTGFIGDFTPNIDLGPYEISYTKAEKDRRATYSYAGLSSSDFISIPNSGGGRRTGAVGGAAAETTESLAAVSWSGSGDAVSVSITPVGGYTYSVQMRKAGEDFSEVSISGGESALTAQLPVAKGELAEVRVIAEKGDAAEYNSYYVDRSGETNVGYLYASADGGTMAYVMADEMNSYTVIADNTMYQNGEYRSVSQATHVTSDNGVTIDSGEIYAVAAHLAEIDYSTLSWFKYDGSGWTRLDTDYSEEENMNIGARADLDGEGMYVLMAKESRKTALPAEDLRAVTFDPETDRDATATLTFTDPNTGSKFYNVYYSDSPFTDKNEEGVVVRSFYADSGTELTLNLYERGRTVYAAVEIALEDGGRSPLSDVILVAGEADSDGDGIPDWYCDEYLLWDKGDSAKPVAQRDPDGDGLTNLEEYLGGSDPTDPDSPVHTSKTPVTSVSITPAELQVAVGGTGSLTAHVMPENATNQAVTWRSDDESVVTVSGSGAGTACTVTGVSLGTAVVTVTTSDGGYAASVTVTVSDTPAPPEHIHSWAAAWSSDAAHHWHECEADDCPITTNSEKDRYGAHTSDGGKVTTAATEYQDGIRTYSCAVCGYVLRTERIPATGGDTPVGGSPSSGGNSSSGSSYQITVSNASHGTLAVTHTSAKSGTKVDITATPDDGYATGSVTVTDSGGRSVSVTDNGNGSYTFTMPASRVTVSAVFTAIAASHPATAEPGSSTGGSETSWVNPFTDMSESDWFYSYGQYVAANGLMVGDGSATVFNPNGTMTRAMVWTVLGRMAGADVNGTAGTWYAKAQDWAVMNNVSDGTNPNSSISRQELVTMLWRYIGSPAATAGLSQFGDYADVADWADNAMQWAVSTGLIVGDDNRMNPVGNARRCEVATIFMRFCENIVK